MVTAKSRQGSDGSGPLVGIRILDFSSVVMGPYATMILANLGADIIKVEAPNGDVMRQVGPMKNPGMGQSFLHTNRGKRSISLDLKHPKGQKAALRLAADADVVVSNMRPAALSRLGLDYESVRHVNPSVVFATAVGYGSSGRYAGQPAYDDLIQGLTAIPSLVLESGVAQPRYLPTPIADRAVGLYLSGMISAALFHRERTGEGQSVEVPMFEVLSQFVLGDHMGGMTYDPQIGPPHYARLISGDRRPYRSKDGYVCVLIYTDRNWKSFLELIGQPERFESDERFSSHRNRSENIDYVYSVVSDEIEKKTTAEWLSIFAENDIPATVMHSISTLIDDDHLADVGFFQWVSHPTEGIIRTMAAPETWSKTPSSARGHAPTLGENTAEILSEIGMKQSEIEEALSAWAFQQS